MDKIKIIEELNEIATDIFKTTNEISKTIAIPHNISDDVYYCFTPTEFGYKMKVISSIEIEQFREFKKGKMSQQHIENNDKKGDIDIDMAKGSITKRKDGRWMGRYGKKVCVYAKTKKECEERLKQALSELNSKPTNTNNNFFNNTEDITNNENKDYTLSKTMTLNTWFEYFLEFYKSGVLKKSSLITYQRRYNFIKDDLGNRPINKITEMDIKRFIDSMPNESRKKQTYSILKELFAKLRDRNFIKENVVDRVVLTFNKKKDINDHKEDERQILTPEDEVRLFDELKNKKIYHYCRFLLYTGMRKGEALALTWNDIDFNKGEININKAFDSINKEISTPKSEAGIRKIPLFDEARKVLLELKEKHKNVKSNKIFYDINDRSASSNFCYYANTIGLKCSLHYLKHTFATRCLEAGIEPKVVQAWLGHSSYEVTVNTYTHLSKKLEDKETKKINNFFSNKFDTRFN